MTAQTEAPAEITAHVDRAWAAWDAAASIPRERRTARISALTRLTYLAAHECDSADDDLAAEYASLAVDLKGRAMLEARMTGPNAR